MVWLSFQKRVTTKVRANVLIFKTGQLGDSLVSIPAIRAIFESNKDSDILLLTDYQDKRKNLISSWSVLGEIFKFANPIFYDPNALAIKRPNELIKFILLLRSFKISKVYVLNRRYSRNRSFLDYIFFRYIVGCNDVVQAENLPHPKFANNKSPYLTCKNPEWMRLLSAVIPLDSFYSHDLIPVTEKYKSELQHLLRDSGIIFHNDLIAIAPGSKMQSKIWPFSYFEELGHLLLSHSPSIQLIVVGGQEDVDVGDRLCASWGARSINFSGRLSIFGSAALFTKCALFIGNDSGAMHLAAMSGLQCICIFSSRDYPGLWNPIGEGHQIFRSEVDCEGCMLEVCEIQKNKCLKAISPQSIFSAAKIYL